MKKALVYYLYGIRNAGDMAICIGAIELLKKLNYEITMVSRFSEKEDEFENSKNFLLHYYPEVKVFPGPFSFERDFSVFKKVKVLFCSMLKIVGIIPDKKMKQLIKNSDVVFFNGGNLLRGKSIVDYIRLTALFYPVKIAYKLKKPILCLPQSTSQISYTAERILNRNLKYFEKIYVREPISYKELAWRFPHLSFTLSTDLAFLCKDTDTATIRYKALHLEMRNHNIAVVVRNTGIGDISELTETKQNMLMNEVIRIVDKYADYGFLIVVQTDKDRLFSQKLYNRMKKNVMVKIVENHDPLVLREIYKHMDFIITMRLHAGILALSALTPVVGVFSEEWGLKNPGIMEDFCMPYCIIEHSNDIHEDFIKKSIQSDIAPYLKKKQLDLINSFGSFIGF